MSVDLSNACSFNSASLFSVRVGDGIVATKGRVLYDAGPLVDYNAIALEHIARYEAGEINSRGDPLPPTSAVDSSPSTPDSVLALLE